jgi:hypothetical protein
MPVLHKCPKVDSPPSEFAPVIVATFDDELPMAVCSSACGGTYPDSEFKQLRS